MALPIINTKEDLDAIGGTEDYVQFMDFLRGTMTKKVDVAIYPDGYGQPDYTGEEIPPVWEEVEDLSVITSFGFTKDELIETHP
jgi:hypothetical protein